MQRRDQVRGLALGVAYPAPGTDGLGGRRPGGVLDLGDLRSLPPSPRGQFQRAQPSVGVGDRPALDPDVAGVLIHVHRPDTRCRGERIQYSVFICDLSDEEAVTMRADIEVRIKHTEDSVMIIDLGRAGDSSRFLFLGHHEKLPATTAVIV